MSAEQIAVENIIDRAVEGSPKAADGQVTVREVVPEATTDELRAARAEKDEAQRVCDEAATVQTVALGASIVGLVAAPVAMYANSDQGYLHKALQQLPAGWGILILWALLAAAVILLYVFVFRRRFITTKEALAGANEKLIAARISTEAGRKLYYREELFRLSGKAQRIFFDDEHRARLASRWSEEASKNLYGSETVGSLTVVNSCLSSLNELVSREEREQRDEKHWQNWAIFVMVVYVGLLLTSAVLTNRNDELLAAKVFGVPLSVILWGAAGSLAAILYRFYTEQGRIRFAAEFRWLIARPIIGIIMGAVVYLALYSGLILVVQNDAAAANAPDPSIRMEAFWITSFLAGFSDKFYLGVIDLLVARTVRSEEVDANTVVTQKERIPEAAGDEPPVANLAVRRTTTTTTVEEGQPVERKTAAATAEATTPGT